MRACVTGKRTLDLRDGVESCMSHTVKQEVFNKAVHTVRTAKKIVYATDQPIHHKLCTMTIDSYNLV